ncbi:hypothetical protein [Altererythrobacter sp. ZODW24]|uniref:hypothetical protein n=1 Tax=Altererythrobacter sp. ZODW24 TaxID=2185142 RepID=UPI001F085C8C|nr:hypothetical protein [Altererythrobacter sp. ZODW24]
MTTGTSQTSGPEAIDGAAANIPAEIVEPIQATDVSGDSWSEIRADDALQFSPIETEPKPEPPTWLQDLFEWMGDLFAPLGRGLIGIWPILKWVLLAAAISLLLWLLWKLIEPYIGGPKREKVAEEEWVPQREEALALLSDADRLAAEGNYDEATHLLLQRSVSQIATARPEWLEPSSTAREIAALPALPEAARAAFTAISERVERSMFALRRLGADDWQAARTAYADFALERL